MHRGPDRTHPDFVIDRAPAPASTALALHERV
jgi:hypothetical protein